MAESGPEESAAEGNRFAGTRDGEGWIDDRYEYRPVRIDGDVPRLTAAVRLAIQAEFSGWELSRLRLYPGGVRKVVLRRRISHAHGLLPEPTF
ncbi:hypothetical protein Ae168Ps1_4654c [Pseudonocardia sp. Ae168_Ps1]|uniref:DUF5703 family protein n=1 Tax=unclassified Pseudonocardia TaxID=2619320 RepID=UPI00094B35AC|nr:MULTISPECIES: DUF5703 family protein [unclassified Pseudonocardia]OLL76249.1 hypothetical protein Ae150APs1_4627c [Pseudonocardia sp. Ae150A_Ps1]OLL82248.1 hypothetical protein Ae168Ps1_4654c [Pseudonocardia sp. Ae168_Ps1]OLL83636.1 hypothetical protein Ae263Ps1_0691 [Pseudonocardia sp. Ae263_Ps1]OLL90324.1 hypothetical protein Ae356Ps1_0221c [Pseudonocardia sp. Ae356_Ps1]